MNKKELQEKIKQEAIQHLQELLSPGDTVYTSLKHVSRSGMFRVIETLISREERIVDISSAVCLILGNTYNNRHGGVPIGGCGMDMGFDIVYRLSYALFPDGFDCIGEKCLSNDHFNSDRDYSPHHHNAGGYALKHQWL